MLNVNYFTVFLCFLLYLMLQADYILCQCTSDFGWFIFLNIMNSRDFADQDWNGKDLFLNSNSFHNWIPHFSNESSN